MPRTPRQKASSNPLETTAGPVRSWRRIAGFACSQGFVYAAFYMGDNHELFLGPFALERAELLITLLFMLLSLLAARLAAPTLDRMLGNTAAIGAAGVALAAASLASAAPGDSIGPRIAIECAGLGLAMGFMLMAWGRAFGEATPRLAAAEIMAATGIAGASCFILSFLDQAVAVGVRSALPLAAACLLALGWHHADEKASRREGAGASPLAAEATKRPSTSEFGEAASAGGATVLAPESRTRTLSRRMLAGAALFGLAAGFVETYRSDPGALSTPTLPAALLILALFCVAVLQTLTPNPHAERDTFGGMYRTAVLVIMTGFLFAPALAGSGVPGDSIVLAGYLGLTAALAALFLAMASLSGASPAAAFARGFAALYAGEAVGIVVGNAFDAASPAGATPYFVMAFAGLAALLAYLYLFTERDFRALSEVVDEPDIAAAARERIAADAGLSPREAEVLALALRGRTNERIAAELFVAKSTVDTHLRRIYAKCGVHSRQELIDLGERAAADMRTSRRG